MRWAPAALAAVVLLAASPAAHAVAVSGAELRALARRAADDPAALARLRAVDRVDGRPVDVAGALQGADAAELRSRVAILAAATATGRGGDPRSAARGILAERRFHGTSVPGPFRGLIHRASRWLRSALDWIDRVLPGGRAVVWVVLSGLVFLAAALVSRRALSGRVRAAGRAAAAARPARDDPRALERRAEQAEAAGDHALAVRLRFRAGLLRLGIRPSQPTGEVARALGSEDFDALARTFDEVIYGGRTAGAADSEEARRRWPAVTAQ